MNSLLLEIVTEEIPAGYIEPALDALASMLSQKLTAARIGHGSHRTLGTPRRLAVIVERVENRQQSLSTEVLGPPKKLAFDGQGRPTVAAEKFAEKLGVAVNRLRVKETPRGPYLCATKKERGQSAKTLLKTILPEVILATPFPKTMRWADLSIEFARPIHLIVALLGNSIVSFKLGNIKSGRLSYGHRFVRPGKIKIENPEHYIQALHAGHVLVDSVERKKQVKDLVSQAAQQLGGRIWPDRELIDIVSNLVESPEVVAGKFDRKYLELPAEVLITAMREHQKYFAVMDGHNRLMPCFITVNNTPARDMALVATGNERVLRARLEDARFFFKSDLGVALDEWVQKLKGVLFQAKLGSMYEKVQRVQKIAEYLADALQGHPGLGSPDFKQAVSTAAWLCKADLVSQMVGEFPKLQGVMGRIYAAKAGQPDSVASAIEEHYQPTYSGGPLPETLTGAVLGIADKIDSLCGCFSVGLIPTGASDPYALRRQGIGILQIMSANGFGVSLKGMILASLRLFNAAGGEDDGITADKVYTFLQSRIEHMLIEEGFSKDVIAAVINVSVDHIPNVWKRLRALENLKAQPDFEPLSISFKRVVNIIKKADESRSQEAARAVDSDLFEHASESALFKAYREVKQKVAADLEQGSFDQALRDMASMRAAVDVFFDDVMVMTEDRNLRCNRLVLLGKISELFGTIADFSKIST